MELKIDAFGSCYFMAEKLHKEILHKELILHAEFYPIYEFQKAPQMSTTLILWN